MPELPIYREIQAKTDEGKILRLKYDTPPVIFPGSRKICQPPHRGGQGGCAPYYAYFAMATRFRKHTNKSPQVSLAMLSSATNGTFARIRSPASTVISPRR